MSPEELLLLTVVALATSVVSAVVGFGGGILLLGALALVLDPFEAIAVHAAVQLVGNATRAHAHRRMIDWSAVARLTALVVPGSLLGLTIARNVPTDTIRHAMGALIILVAWWPRATDRLARHASTPVLVGVGAMAGVGNVTVGATGPLLAPFFRAITTDRLAFVGTFAASQTIGHMVKLLVLTAGGVAAPGDHAGLIGCSIVAVIVGTRLGTLVLRRVSERRFGQLLRVALTLVGLRLLWEGVA